jgi:hypothetical protein
MAIITFIPFVFIGKNINKYTSNIIKKKRNTKQTKDNKNFNTQYVHLQNELDSEQDVMLVKIKIKMIYCFKR